MPGEFAGRRDDGSRGSQGLIHFLCLDDLVGELRILELVAAPAQRAEALERGTELVAHCQLDGVVAILGRRPQSLLRKDARTSESSGVVGQRKGRVRVRIGELLGTGKR